jgi:hypothetical protein
MEVKAMNGLKIIGQHCAGGQDCEINIYFKLSMCLKNIFPILSAQSGG